MTSEYTTDDAYVTDDAQGEGWRLMLGDSCERLAEIPDDSIDLSVCSPPFASLYTYSPSLRDLGNCSTRGEFIDHYSLHHPRAAAGHQAGPERLRPRPAGHHHEGVEGIIGLTDFRGEVIRAFQAAGWIFFGEVTIWKNPQAQAIRTKAHALMFPSKNRDSAGTRPALADYLLIFKKPGENAVPIPHEATTGEVTNDDWIEWASPIWFDAGDGGDLGGNHLSPVWTTIKETNTLNERVARESDDERHLCPLQLDFIERCVRLWSNPGETVLTPFAGIGSEVWVARKFGRRGVGVELKASYWRTAVDNLRRLDGDMQQESLFDV